MGERVRGVKNVVQTGRKEGTVDDTPRVELMGIVPGTLPRRGLAERGVVGDYARLGALKHSAPRRDGMVLNVGTWGDRVVHTGRRASRLGLDGWPPCMPAI